MRNFPDRLNGNWLIVKPLQKEEEIIGGLIIPETANADLNKGLVLMVSDNIKNIVSKGETVVYPSKAGLGQIVNGEPYLWLEAHQVWAVFSEEKSGN